MLTLYYSPGACSLAPHILLEEIGHPFALKRIMLAEGQQHTAEFRAINRHGRVPVLQLGDGTLLTEQPAISLFLASAYPEAGLLPVSPLSLARTLEWLNWLSGTVQGSGFVSVFRPARFSDDGDAQASISAFGRKQLEEYLSEIEERLSGMEYAVDNRYGAVDPFLLTLYRWGMRIKIDMPALYPLWTAHSQRLLERSAIQRALIAEGISLWS